MVRYIISTRRIAPEMRVGEMGDETNEKNGF